MNILNFYTLAFALISSALMAMDHTNLPNMVAPSAPKLDSTARRKIPMESLDLLKCEPAMFAINPIGEGNIFIRHRSLSDPTSNEKELRASQKQMALEMKASPRKEPAPLSKAQETQTNLNRLSLPIYNIDETRAHVAHTVIFSSPRLKKQITKQRNNYVTHIEKNVTIITINGVERQFTQKKSYCAGCTIQ